MEKIKENLEGRGYQINEIVGSGQTILGVIGDTSALDMNMLKVNECVDKVMRVQEPFKRANRSFHPEDSVIDVSGVKIGGRKLAVIAGPCSVEMKADCRRCQIRKTCRCNIAARRCFQTAYIAILFPGIKRRRA